MADAVACVAELRVRIGSPARMYKANHLLREKHRRTLEWFLGPDGPISGRARVVLVDKERFLLGTFLGLLANPDIPGWIAAPTPGWIPGPAPAWLAGVGPSRLGAAIWDRLAAPAAASHIGGPAMNATPDVRQRSAGPTSGTADPTIDVTHSTSDVTYSMHGATDSTAFDTANATNATPGICQRNATDTTPVATDMTCSADDSTYVATDTASGGTPSARSTTDPTSVGTDSMHGLANPTFDVTHSMRSTTHSTSVATDTMHGTTNRTSGAIEPTSAVTHSTSDVTHPTRSLTNTTSSATHPTSDVTHSTRTTTNTTSSAADPTSDVAHPTRTTTDPTVPDADPMVLDADPTVLDAVNELLRGRLSHDEFRRRAPGWPAEHNEAIRAIAARQSRRNPDRVVLDPLFWAITRIADVWGGPVAVVHDRHLSLTPVRVAALVAAGGLARFDIASAGLDARVQLADFLAGIVRRTYTAVFDGSGDPALLDLVRPYLATSS